MIFEIEETDGLGRLGKITANKKDLVTPNLFPVVHPSRNLIEINDIKKIGAQCIFTNSYIIFKDEGLREKILKTKLHDHFKFDGLIATDSGAFQQYMYEGSEIPIEPELIETFQENIQSDFPVILDIPVQLDDNYELAKKKVSLTIKRAKDNLLRRKQSECHWFGPIHGARFTDLLVYCAQELSKLDFDLYAVGGLVKAFLDYRFDLTINMLMNVKRVLVPNKPLHMFGLGLPQFFSLAVASGCDLMDSAAYILFAMEDRYFTLSTGTKRLQDLEEFPCHCPICTKYTPKEIIKFDKKLRTNLLAKHNLYLSFSELRSIRQAIKEGNLLDLVEERISAHPSLVDAYKVYLKHNEFIEAYEKGYKKRGRMLTSSLSYYRPLLYRFEKRIKTHYKPPEEAKYLIILPELDATGKNSPESINWLNKLNLLSQRNTFHVVFISEFFGLIPLELIETFPLGQNESVKNIFQSPDNDYFPMKRALNYFEAHSENYEKFLVLIPEKYTNQFEEEVDFDSKKAMKDLIYKIKKDMNINLLEFNDIDTLLSFLTEIK